jgi:hypothetical protein
MSKKRKTARRELVKAGNVVFVRDFHPPLFPGNKKWRTPKKNPTHKAMEEQNDRNAKRELWKILNLNFHDGDYHFALTYKIKPTPERAKKDKEYFQRKLNALYRKYDVCGKWLTATEYKHKRIHHHYIASGNVSFKEIEKLWKHGQVRKLNELYNGDYEGLANYIIKETQLRFRAEEAVYKRRWNGSRMLERPKTRREEITEEQLLNPVAPDGWYVDKDEEYFYQGVNPYTGRAYANYILRPLPWNRSAEYPNWDNLEPTRPRPTNTAGWLSKNYPKQYDIVDCKQTERTRQNE